ncbi:MAG: DEAD/DEAH box helicase [Deltaproteobacteria bacterium]|nr:DEAD/DEAH box helicase [Deltaproteobacteria bacterium]
MPFANLRAMLITFDSRSAARWRRLALRQVLLEGGVPSGQYRQFERAFGASLDRPVGDFAGAATLRTFDAGLLRKLASVLEDHLDKYLDRAEGGAAPEDELVTRLRGLGLGDRLYDKTRVLGAPALERRLRIDHGFEQIGELALASAERVHPNVLEGKRRARAYLQQCIRFAELADEAARAQASVDARPLRPELGRVDAQLAALAPKVAVARPRGTHGPGETRFVPPGTLVYSEADAGGKAVPLASIDLSGGSPRIEVPHARKSDRAALVPAVVAAARRHLRSPESPQFDELVRVAGRPSWVRALAAFDEVLDADSDDEGVLHFRLWKTRRSLSIEPCVHDGCDARGRIRWAPRASLFDDSASDPDDARALRAVGPGGYGAPTSVIDQLYALLGHPRVLFGDDAQPVSVVVGRPLLRAHDTEQGGVRLELLLDGRALSPADVVDERCALVHDPDAGSLTFAELSDREHGLLRAIADFGAVLPPEARASVLPRLERIARGTEVELLGDLGGRLVPHDTRIVVQLDGARWPELSVALRARALPGADVRVPGQGSPHVRARIGDEPVQCVRDFERIVALLAVLRSVEGVVLEWKTPPVQVVGSFGSELRVAIRQKGEWFSIGADAVVDQHEVGLAVLLEAARRGQGYVEVAPGKLVQLEADLRTRLLALSDHVRARRDGALEVAFTAAPALAALTHQVDAPAAFARVLERVRDGSEPEVPAPMAEVLRPYQREGFAWLARLASWGAGGILADDMGLGKTVQAIALLLARAAEGPALVVAPTSVVGNWLSELEQFGRGLRPIDYRSAGRSAVLGKLRQGDVLVVSYDLVARDVEKFERVTFATLIVDEAQAAKNANTQRARAVRALRRDVCFALTGTPIENHLGELWSIAGIACPGLLGSWESFRARFAEPIQCRHDPPAREALQRLVRPFLLRRTKESVAPELPQLTELTRSIVFGTRERATYEAARRVALSRLVGLVDDPKGRVCALAELMRLRRLACHPRLAHVDGDVPSAKLEATLEAIDAIVEGGHRGLVFSQFVDHLAIVREALDERGIDYLYLDGSTKASERPALVQAFQSGKAPLFLISLRAGGTGLNLTAADYVLHLDPWWNPAVEDQATDRAHRIGQLRPVTVVRMVAAQTIEESVVALHARKRALAECLLDGAEAAGKLSLSELVDLVRGTPDVEGAARVA